MAHRGPDDEGFYLDGPVLGLGNRRLSIIDLPGGHQPNLERGRVRLDYLQW
jgi:asparagine synthase (glutamine-hydrolysing)